MNESPYFISAVKALLPEILLTVAILLVPLWHLFLPKARGFTSYISLIGLVSAFVFLWQQYQAAPQVLFGGLFTLDKLTTFFGLLACFVGIVIVFITMGYEQHLGDYSGEFYAILLAAVLSIMLLAGTTDLIMLFVGLETLTICCVLLSGFAKQDRKSNEACLKYLLSTAAVTATFLYGLSFLYGLTGSTGYYEIQQKMLALTQSPSLVMIFLMILLISAIGFKLSVVPFHMWTPDVYEGAPTPVTAFLAVGAKIGGIVVAIRLLSVVFTGAAYDWTVVLQVLAIASMVIGNIIALAQKSLKRMLAYSSIAHIGYILIGLTSVNTTGLTAVVFYLVVYGFMTLGAFTCAVLIENEMGSDNIDDLAGLIRKRPWLSLGMTVCLINLAGLPIPPAGFLAKFFVFWAGFQINSLMGNLAVGAALITSVPAIYYYSRVAIKMIVREPSAKVAELPAKRMRLATSQNGPMFALALSILGIIAGSIAVNPIMAIGNQAVESAFRKPALGALPTFELNN